MSDLIDRQAAIEACGGYLVPANIIKQLPSAKPKKGRWISADAIFGGVPFYCSECGENTRDTVMGKPRWKFCPMCGSRNEVTE